MSGIKTSSDFKIEYSDFGITKKEIKEKIVEEKLDNSQLSENRIIIGLIIGEIREKIYKQFKKESNNILDIKDIIEILNSPLKLNQKIEENISQINSLVCKILNLDFNSIDENFLNNKVKVDNYIENAKKIIN